MRDPERIDKILDIIRDKWKKYPDTRFGQLISNELYKGHGEMGEWLFSLEDDKLLESLENNKDKL